MARFSHTNAYIEFAGIDISGRTNTCELSVDADVSEVTCFGENWDEFVPNTATWTISVAGFTDQDPGEVEDTLESNILTGEQSIDYRPQGAAVGYKFDGMAILKSYGVGGGLKTGCPYVAVFQGNGALSRSAAP